MDWISFGIQNLYTIITLLNILLAMAIIFLERKNIGVTWAWLMVLLFIPILGFILYFTFGQNMGRRKLYKLKEREKAVVRTVIDNQKRRLKENTLQFHESPTYKFREMIMMNLTTSMALYTQDNEAAVFTDGHDKFNSLLDDIANAQNHIHIMYYIVRADGIGNRLLHALVEKAKQGVKVRFLYDDIGSTRLPKRFFQPLIDAGGEAVAFFPSKIPYLNVRVNYRNHRKLVIIDGKIGYIGGFNVGDEYLGLNRRFGYWRDTHMRLEGSAVLQMQVQFLLDWNLATKELLEVVDDHFPTFKGKGKAGMQIVSSGPDSELEQIKNGYIKLIHQARYSICIQTPYFIPDESMLHALKSAAYAGVDIRIMIPSVPDHKMVYWATYSYLKELLPLGVRYFLYEKGFLHAKTIVIDGFAASVGTANFDIRSFKLNFETNAFIYDSELGGQLLNIFEKDLEDCRELTLEEYEGRSMLQKVRESITRLLSPIL